MGNWFTDFFSNGVKTLGEVGKNVANFVGNVGKSALDGITSVGKGIADGATKFAKDVGNFFGGWGQNIADGWNNGWARFGEGVEQMKQGAGFSGFINAASGALYGLTGGGLGAVEATNDHILANSTEVVDDLGNVTYVAKGEENWFQSFMRGMARGTIANDKNVQTAIKDAIAAGDMAEANAIMGKQVGKVALKTLEVGAAVGGIVAIPFTGGLSAGATAAVLGGIGVGGVAAGMGHALLSDHMQESDMDMDATRRINAETKALMEQGLLSEENREAYEQTMVKYYGATSVYNNGGVNVGSIDKGSVEAMLRDKGVVNGMTPDQIAECRKSYDEAYKESVDKGLLTADQADRLATLGTMYEMGKLNEEQYCTETYAVQFENFDVTDEQRTALASITAKRDLGIITENDYNAILTTEAVFKDFRQPDGSVVIPTKSDDGLMSRVAESDSVEQITEAKARDEVSKETETTKETTQSTFSALLSQSGLDFAPDV